MTQTRAISVAVVGGGITGLVTAFELSKALGDRVEISLFEAGPRPGGKIHTLAFAGGWVEAGPDSWLAREPALEDLCRSLGLADDLTKPAVFGAVVWIAGRLRRFAQPSLWGLPATPMAALRAAPLSPTGRLRALVDLVLPGPLVGPDVSVGDFVVRRFGREVLERLVDPLLAGTRAGSVDTMSLAAALPQVDALARANRSVMRAAPAATSAPRFLSVAGGMERLVDRLTTALGDCARLYTNAPVTHVQKVEDGYELPLDDGARVHADAVVLCVPAPAAGALLDQLAPDAARLLREIEYAPAVSIALRYPRRSLAVPPKTSGVLVPRSEGRTISACTWWSAKWPRATPDSDGEVVRCFVGRTPDEELPDDDDVVTACARDVAAITGTSGAPTETAVTRWTEGLPQYTVGHLDRLAQIEAALADHPAIALAGAGYRGSGLADCVAQAHEAARRITTSLAGASASPGRV